MSNDTPTLKFDGFQDAKAVLVPQFWPSTLSDDQTERFEAFIEKFGFEDGAILVTPSIVAGCNDGETELSFDELEGRVERFERGEPQ